MHECIDVYNIYVTKHIMNIYNNGEFMYKYFSAGNMVDVWKFETVPGKYTNILYIIDIV